MRQHFIIASRHVPERGVIETETREIFRAKNTRDKNVREAFVICTSLKRKPHLQILKLPFFETFACASYFFFASMLMDPENQTHCNTDACTIRCISSLIKLIK
ncbi:hypothetical protein K1719_001697 [Acacia pycnantha]|nr:hypothetical protein K1719_001697 [Acacia pycnantha]